MRQDVWRPFAARPQEPSICQCRQRRDCFALPGFNDGGAVQISLKRRIPIVRLLSAKCDSYASRAPISAIFQKLTNY